MDPATRRNTKNGNGILLHFSRLCKLRSVAVPSSNIKAKPACDAHIDTSSDKELYGFDENQECKVHPEPLKEASSHCLEADLISELFTTISALKLAYVRLQQAHIPYEPKKIDVADKIMVSELDSLSKLEEGYVSLSSISLKIQEYRKSLMQLQFKMQNRELEIHRLSKAVEELDEKNEELQKKMKQKALQEKDLFQFDWEVTPNVFSIIFKFTTKAIHEFAKPLIGLMKASGWDLNLAASSLDSCVIYAEKSHKKYAFEAHLSQIMFGAKTDERFTFDEFDRVMRYQDPFDALLADSDSGFSRFCCSVYSVVIPSKMERSFFCNLDQRTFVFGGGHPRTPFYQAFVKMARWVWALKVLANSFIPKADMFYVKKGNVYCEDYMECVLDHATSEGIEKHRVGFTVTPGFRIGSTIVRCRVYLCAINSSIDKCGFSM